MGEKIYSRELYGRENYKSNSCERRNSKEREKELEKVSRERKI